MKIIDEKGRLFGKINLIDLLVIVLVVAVVAAVGWKLVGKKAAAGDLPGAVAEKEGQGLGHLLRLRFPTTRMR